MVQLAPQMLSSCGSPTPFVELPSPVESLATTPHGLKKLSLCRQKTITPCRLPRTQKVTAKEDEKILRRRLQYKLHQRRHRAKQKLKIKTLEQEVGELHEQIQGFEMKRKHYAMGALRSFSGSGIERRRSPTRVVTDFCQVFHMGYCAESATSQYEFLSHIMSSAASNVETHGAAQVFELFRHYHELFSFFQCCVQSFDISTLDHVVLIIVRLTLRLSFRREHVCAVCPALANRQDLVMKLSEDVMEMPASFSFIFEPNGLVSRFDLNMDLLDGFYCCLGSLCDTAACLEQCRLQASLSLPSDIKTEQMTRMDVEYLLS